MRLKLKPKPDLYHMQSRHKSGFLFFPKVIQDELRWLEKATWEEVCRNKKNKNGMKWYAVKWIIAHNSKSRSVHILLVCPRCSSRSMYKIGTDSFECVHCGRQCGTKEMEINFV